MRAKCLQTDENYDEVFKYLKTAAHFALVMRIEIKIYQTAVSFIHPPGADSFYFETGIPMNAHVMPAGEMKPARLASRSDLDTRSNTPVAAPVSQPFVVGIVLLCDIAVLMATSLTAQRLALADKSWVWIILMAAAVTAATIAALQWRYLYTMPALMRLERQLTQCGLWLFVSLAAIVIGAFLAGSNTGAMRPWFILWFAAGWAGMAMARVGVALCSRRWKAQGRLARRTVIAGGGEAAASLIETLEQDGHQYIHILGLFDDRGEDRSPELVGPYKKLGRFEDLEKFCREQRVDLIMIALPPAAEDRVLHLLGKLWALPVDVRISAHASKLKLRERAYNYVGGVPCLPVFDRPMSDWARAVKAIEDRVVAALALAALLPVFAVAALAVKLSSPGPIFFRQQRYGFNNEPIGVYKLRSMYVDQSDAKAAKLVTRDDPRVTRAGRILRKTSIDELPQLINVLRGELSLVGPRPHAMQAKADGHTYDAVVEHYFARHKVKPGITGWAQINGWRGETDTVEKIEQRVRYDLHYIDIWSLLFDLYILFKTPFSLLDTKNAY